MNRNRSCVVKTCQHHLGTKDSKIQMFRFPTDPEKRKRWTKIIQNENGKNYSGGFGYVCSEHFSPSQFNKSSNKCKLIENSYPDLIPELNERNTIYENENENETIDDLKRKLQNVKLSNEIELQKLNENIKRQQQKIEILEEEIRDLKRNNGKLEKAIRVDNENEILVLGSKTSDHTRKIKILLNCFINGVKGHERYPENVREFCICLHYHSPRAYEYFREIFSNNLPSVSTIRAWYGNSCLDSNVGISKSSLHILKCKAEQKKSEKSELLCSLVFDEMFIRQHTQWNNSSKRFLGYSTYGKVRGVAKQALVYMVVGINDDFNFPIANHFITSIDSNEKRELLMSIVDALDEINVTIANITFDGHATNIAMCKQLGANLDVDSDNFQPFFELENGKRIFIWFDPCHMIKLVRNAIGSKKQFIDSEGNAIDWSHYERLVEISQTNGFDLTHKMTNKHLDWKRRIMKVDLAAQTLSGSTANAIEILRTRNLIGFENAAGTVKFTHFFNRLFDIFNSKCADGVENSKRALSVLNKDEIFQYCHQGVEYIKGLQFMDEKNQMHLLYKSKIKTAFLGFMIDIKSLSMIYQKYVTDLGILSSIRTFYFCQDFIEIFFGKIRSLGGFNDNPTHEQFAAAVRKITVNKTIKMSLEGNCLPIDITSKPFSDILFVTSRRKKIDHNDNELLPTNAEMNELMSKLDDIERMERNNILDGTKDFNISFIAQIIENKLMKSDRKTCVPCSNIFIENKKLLEARIAHNFSKKPCLGTFKVCKAADRFLRIELISESSGFSIIYHAISDAIDLESLFPDTDFNHDKNHLFYIVKLIIDAYIQIKCTYIARTITLDHQKNFLRSKLLKLIHCHGQ